MNADAVFSILVNIAEQFSYKKTLEMKSLSLIIMPGLCLLTNFNCVAFSCIVIGIYNE